MYKRFDLNYKVEQFLLEYRRSNRNNPSGIAGYYNPRALADYLETKAVYAELKWPFVYQLESNPKFQEEADQTSKEFTWRRFEFLTFRKFQENQITNNVDLHVLYRIIERGGNRAGPRRGLLFANDFSLDINIPIAYSIDWSDPYLYNFLRPLLLVLDVETICPSGYFFRESEKLRNIKEIKLEDVISKLALQKEMSGALQKLPVNV